MAIGQNVNIKIGAGKKLILTLIDELEGLRTSVEEVTAKCGGNSKGTRTRNGSCKCD